MNEINKPTSEEEVLELEQQIERARKMQSMVNSSGWTDLMIHYLEGSMKGAIDLFEKAVTIENFVAAQSTYMKMKQTLGFVNNTITLGEAAHQKLHPPKDGESAG